MGIDPVGVDENNVHSHNRYAYANNNPYKFVDPDGRAAILIPLAIATWEAIQVRAGLFIISRAGQVAIGVVAGETGAVATGLEAKAVTNGIKSASTRAKEINAVLDPRAQRSRTAAVTETEEGISIVSSSARRLTPAQRKLLGPNELEGVGVGHAEVTGINAAKEMGLTPTGAAASRPICAGCACTLCKEGVKPLSPLK